MMRHSTRQFDTLPDGRAVTEYTMTNSAGASVSVLDWGAAVSAVCVPDRMGRLENVALSFDTVADYLASGTYAGAAIGRVGNRLSGARFVLNGKPYALAANDGSNHLHGGAEGFDRKLWQAQVEEDSVSFTYCSPDGEEGYPGSLRVTVRYGWTEDCRLRIGYLAGTDADTLCNLTNHSYWRLGGPESDPREQTLCIHADFFTPITGEVLPTGAVEPVAGALDLRNPVRLADGIGSADPQIRLVNGYDHNFVLRKGEPDEPSLAAELCDPASGRRMEVFTTLPGIQFYSGRDVNGRHTGMALETQYFPDAMAHPWFPSIVLRAGQRHRSYTEYHFSAG